MRNIGSKTLGISRHRSSGGGSHRPLVSEFTQVNVASSTLSDDVDALRFQIINNASAVNWRLLVQSTPATPYNVRMQFYWNAPDRDSTTCGIYFVDASNVMSGIEQVITHSAGKYLRVQHNSSPTSAGATPWQGISPGPWGALDGLGNFNQASTASVWIRLRNDGTTLFYDYSSDGTTWVNAYSESVGSFITPTGIGIGGISIDNSSGQGIDLHVISLTTDLNATF